MDQGPIRVLQVDDESEFLDLATTYLSRQDDRFSIETASSADAGLDCLAANDFDCIISDYDMPGMNGIDFLQAVREDYPELPFILFTGKGSEEVASEAVSAGVTDYLQKQGASEQYELLANRVTNAVEQRRARTQAEENYRVSSVVREINQALVQATSREEIDHHVCQILTDADPYVFAWIGTLNHTTNRIEPRGAAGIGEEDYLDNITVTVDDSPTGQGPGGTAYREDRVVVSQDIDQDDAFGPWREAAREQGYRAVAAIPLTHEDTQYGLLGVYADRTAAFDESERELLGELGDTIAHAYHRLDIQQEYEDQYRYLFEEAPVMFTFTREVDGEPIIEECNQLFAETLGYSREHLRGTRLAEVYTEESARALLEGGGYDRALSGEFLREQREFVTNDGGILTTMLRATPRRNSEGELIGTHALFVDITHKNERLSSLFEQFPEPVIAYAHENGDPYIEKVNEAFTQTFGYETEEAIGQNVDSLLVPDEPQAEAKRIDDRFQAGEAIDELLRRKTRTGLRDFRFLNIPLSAEGAIDGYAIYADVTERRRREEELRQEQNRFQTLFEHLSQPLVEVEYDGPDPIVTGVNAAFEETFGYDASTIVGESLDAYIVPERYQEEADNINQHVRRGGELVSREVTRQTADGSREFLLENAVYEDGSGGFAIYTDVTEQLEQERTLRRLVEDIDALIDTNSKEETCEVANDIAGHVLDVPLVGIHLLSDDGDRLEAVAARDDVRDEFGVPQSYDRNGNEAVEELVWEVFQSGESRYIEDTRNHAGLAEESPARSGLMYPLDDYGVLIATTPEPNAFDETERGYVELLGQALTAVLGRFGREEQLRQQNRQLEELHRAGQEIIQADTRINIAERVVDGAQSILNYPITMVRDYDESVGGLVPAAATDEVYDVFESRTTFTPGGGSLNWSVYESGSPAVFDDLNEHEQAVDSDTPVQSLMILPIGDHGTISVGSTTVDRFDEGDLSLTQLLATTAELALSNLDREQELVSQRNELRRQNERLDEFTSIVSHDLRSPLNVAEGRLELAGEECESEHLDAADQALQRMGTLIDDLLSLASVGQDVGQLEPVALSDLVERCWKNVDTESAQFVAESGTGVLADKTRLQQLLENLIRNAVEHGGETVTVTIGRLEDGFYIADDGPGIPDDQRDQVFDVGYSSTEEGTGFGLNIVKNIVEAHDWAIRVTDSEAGGAKFEITGVEFAE